VMATVCSRLCCAWHAQSQTSSQQLCVTIAVYFKEPTSLPEVFVICFRPQRFAGCACHRWHALCGGVLLVVFLTCRL
jgi:hypothetical protein